MKTIFKDGTYERVSNEIGDFKVNHKDWKFVSKQEWKQNVRDKGKEVDKEKLTKHEETKERRATKHSKIKQNQKTKLWQVTNSKVEPK